MSPTSNKKPAASSFSDKPSASTSVSTTQVLKSPPVIANCPIRPTMGGLQYQGNGTSQYAVAWTGGAPNATWTGLDDPLAIITTPNQTRSTSPKATTSHDARQAGLFPYDATKNFKPGDDLEYFIKELNEALLDKGMDTIAYRRDPLDDSKMINMLTAYPRLNKEAM